MSKWTCKEDEWEDDVEKQPEPNRSVCRCGATLIKSTRYRSDWQCGSSYELEGPFNQSSKCKTKQLEKEIERMKKTEEKLRENVIEMSELLDIEWKTSQ